MTPYQLNHNRRFETRKYKITVLLTVSIHIKIIFLRSSLKIKMQNDEAR